MRESIETKVLVPSLPILRNASQAGHAVAALNFYNAETLLAHVHAANAAGTSIILQTTESTINYLGLELILGMAEAAAKLMKRPTALHLDHGGSFELAKRCIDAGYTSVMFDGSKLCFDENCSRTRQIVELAHSRGVSVEAELGHVTHNDESRSQHISDFYTSAEEAAQFVSKTGVDSLAVAIGTAHGFYRGPVHLDIDRLDQIRTAVGETQLVLHGGSGVPEELLTQAITHGISKINFGTELKNAFTQAVKSSLLSSDDIDLRRTFAPALAAVEAMSLSKIRICSMSDQLTNPRNEGTS